MVLRVKADALKFGSIEVKRYAQLSNNVVITVIESETDPDGINGEWVECEDAGPGWTTEDGGLTFSPPVVIEPVDPCEWLIDIGPFYDRFGAAKMAVLTSSDSTVKAILQDVNIRKWVDLTRPDVAQLLLYVGSKVPTATPELQAAILTTPVADDENRALKKLYFS